jgi:hypothetical protein
MHRTTFHIHHVNVSTVSAGGLAMCTNTTATKKFNGYGTHVKFSFQGTLQTNLQS